MRSIYRRTVTLMGASGLALAALAIHSSPVSGFTQSGVTINFLGSGIPMGHEWITRSLHRLLRHGGDRAARRDHGVGRRRLQRAGHRRPQLLPVRPRRPPVRGLVQLRAHGAARQRHVREGPAGQELLCAAGSEQHTHSQKEVFDYQSGDVIWKPGTRFDAGWKGYKASNMKTVALVATEGMKDVWAAFIRTMNKDDKDRAGAARNEASRLVDSWLHFDRSEMKSWYDDSAHRDGTYVLGTGQSGKGQSVKQCMAGLNVGTDDQDRIAGRSPPRGDPAMRFNSDM